MGRPDLSQEVISTIHIEQIEVNHGFSSIKRKMLSQERGCHSLIIQSKKSMVTYAWSVASEFDYVIVLVFHGSDNVCESYKQDFVLKKSALNPKSDVQHHLLLKDTQACYEQLVSLSKASLYLAVSVFSYITSVLVRFYTLYI